MTPSPQRSEPPEPQTEARTPKLTEHWCIKDDCRHGTLNGSMMLGSMYLREYNRGYAQGRKDADFDAEASRAATAAARAEVARQDPLTELLTNVEYLMEEHGTRVIDIEDLRAVVRDQRAEGSRHD